MPTCPMVPLLSCDAIGIYFAYFFFNRKLDFFFTRTKNIKNYPENRRTEVLASFQASINGPGVNTEYSYKKVPTHQTILDDILSVGRN